jgi:hypothetical protein
VRVLLGGGTQQNLSRIIRKSDASVTFDYVTSDAEPQVWIRKARLADVAIVRTGWISHKAWRNVKAFCSDVVPLPLNGDDAMLNAIETVCKRKGDSWMKMLGWW